MAVTGKGIPNLSFFFKRGEHERGTASLFMSTLAYQLAQQIPSLRPGIDHAIDGDPSVFDKGMHEQHKRLIKAPMEQCRTTAGLPTILLIVIDALDECEGEET